MYIDPHPIYPGSWSLFQHLKFLISLSPFHHHLENSGREPNRLTAPCHTSGGHMGMQATSGPGPIGFLTRSPNRLLLHAPTLFPLPSLPSSACRPPSQKSAQFTWDPTPKLEHAFLLPTQHLPHSTEVTASHLPHYTGHFPDQRFTSYCFCIPSAQHGASHTPGNIRSLQNKMNVVHTSILSSFYLSERSLYL